MPRRGWGVADGGTIYSGHWGCRAQKWVVIPALGTNMGLFFLHKQQLTADERIVQNIKCKAIPVLLCPMIT